MMESLIRRAPVQCRTSFVGCKASFVLVVSAGLILTGCGFHLRDSGQFSTTLKQVYVSGNDAYGAFVRELKTALSSAGAIVEVNAENVPYSIFVLTERSSRRVASTTSQITVSEYELRMQVEFQVSDDSGETIIGPTLVAVERSYALDQTNLIGSYEEEDLLKEEMRRDVIGQIIRRVEALARKSLDK